MTWQNIKGGITWWNTSTISSDSVVESGQTTKYKRWMIKLARVVLEVPVEVPVEEIWAWPHWWCPEGLQSTLCPGVLTLTVCPPTGRRLWVWRLPVLTVETEVRTGCVSTVTSSSAADMSTVMVSSTQTTQVSTPCLMLNLKAYPSFFCSWSEILKYPRKK